MMPTRRARAFRGSVELRAFLRRHPVRVATAPRRNDPDAAEAAVARKLLIATGIVEEKAHSILLVEDDPTVTDAWAAILRKEGYEVAVASNGEEAIDRLRGGLRPSAIILALIMPGVNGWRFRAEQLADPALHAIPLVIASTAAHGSPSIRADFPGVSFIRKDIASGDLVRTVRSAISTDPARRFV